jgi:hypothetical protein
MELIASMGLDDFSELNRAHIIRRSTDGRLRSFEDLYPTPDPESRA